MIRPPSSRLLPAFVAALSLSALAALAPACSPDAEPADIIAIGDLGPADDAPEARAAVLSNLAVFSLRPLSKEPVPQPVGGHVVDQAAAVRLGKALFWDVQAGSDGQTACASCHFRGGADDRLVNTINPGFDNVFDSIGGPGQAFTPAVIQSDDRLGSQGVKLAKFVALSPDPTNPVEECTPNTSGAFGAERQVGFRHTPPTVGAVFFRDQFWGGEGNHTFNGLNVFGFTGNNPAGSITKVENASLASQAVGPTGNAMEMSCIGRKLNGPNSLGAKLLARQPLQFQRVAADDGVLGALANPAGPGLLCGGAPCSYGGLIRQAFGDALADAGETQFSIVWGEAIQAYEATLVPDQTPFDRFLGGELNALSFNQVRGLLRFVGKGQCVNCHLGAMLSDATVSAFETRGPLNRDGGDIGFHNIGVRPTDDDFGRGDLGIVGGVPNSVSGSPFDLGAFKTPSLRNVKLTAPYFHNGGYPTLDAVLDFYSRGGDFDNPQKSADMVPRNFNAEDKKLLADFLTNALTDCRVEKDRAPFDHPELPIPNRAPLPAVGAGGLGACP
jgi:cytochrome c peroxidase